MTNVTRSAKQLHELVPPNWYYKSIYLDKNLIQRFVHNQRFQQVGSVITPVKGRILDIGCADGVFSKHILDKSGAKEVIGIDALQGSIAWARKHWEDEKRLKFLVSDAHRLPFKDQSFDAVFALEVLEHVFEPVKVLQEIKRVLKKDGYGVFLVPAETFIFQLVWYFWTRGKGRVWGQNHLHAYSGNFLVRLAKVLGFHIVVDRKIIFGTLHLIRVQKT